MKIQWSKDLSVDVDVIDKQHQRFLGIVNDLYDAIEVGRSREQISVILGELQTYAKYHFATEEKYFKMFKYKGAEQHIAEHQKMLKTIEGLVRKEKSGENAVVIQTVYFVEEWLKKHLAKVDQKYVPCFHDNGLT